MSEGSPGPQHGGPWKVELDLIIQGRVFIRLRLFLNVMHRLGCFLVVKTNVFEVSIIVSSSYPDSL